MPSSPLDSRLSAMLRTLLEKFVDAAISAAALSGSHARGDADAFSDIDLRLYPDMPLEGIESDRLLYRNGQLVSVSLHTFRGEARQFADPPSAVFAVAPIRTLHVRLDLEGKLADLQQQAHRFRWEDLAAEADAYTARTVYPQTEVVHKVLGGLAASQPRRAMVATAELVQELTLAMAVSSRVLVVSDRSYLRQVYETVGNATAWVEAHRLAAGIATPNRRDGYAVRGRAALALYRETALLTQGSMTEPQWAVVTGCIATIDRHVQQWVTQ